MMKFLKRVWTGGWSVRLSFLFLFLVFTAIFLADPGPILLFVLVAACAIRLLKHFGEYDD